MIDSKESVIMDTHVIDASSIQDCWISVGLERDTETVGEFGSPIPAILTSDG